MISTKGLNIILWKRWAYNKLQGKEAVLNLQLIKRGVLVKDGWSSLLQELSLQMQQTWRVSKS
jgi:hypothetical protein